MLYSVFTPALGIDTGTRYLHRYSVFTPTLSMLHLIYDLWLDTRYLHWCSIFALALDIWNLSHDTWYLDTCTWYMLYLTYDTRHRYLPCYIWRLTYYHLALVYLTWYCDTWPDTITLDTCISLHIHDYHFYGDLKWLLYYYQIIGTPELLYTWTPEIGRLLTLLLILYSCWPP